MKRDKKILSQEAIIQIFSLLSQAIPRPTTELHYNSHFELLIAVILSARTTDKIVNKITTRLFARANTPEKIIALGIKRLQKYIKSSGFFNSKAKNIFATCKILVKDFNSCVPRVRKDLESLPGVGRKTANVVLNIGYGQPTIAVDTHVLRVSNRLGLVKSKTPEGVEAQLLKIVPKKFAKVAGNLLLLHGRYTCIARKPKCNECVLRKRCQDLTPLHSRLG